MNRDHKPSESSLTIPESTRNFLLRHFHSIEQLEILLLLYRDPQRKWVAREVNAAIRTDLSSAENRLKDLCRRQLIVCEPKQDESYYMFAADEALQRSVEELDRYYKTHSTRVIELIYSRPPDAILGFSDSFRIKNK